MPLLADNVFLQIIGKQIPAEILHEDDRALAFRDRHPQAPVHFLVIPKVVIRTHADVTPDHAELVGHLHAVAAKVAREQGLADGYRVVINSGDAGGQTVPHLHLHVLGGRELAWPPG